MDLSSKCVVATPNANQFFKAYTGLQFTIRNGTKVYVPAYTHIASKPNVDATGSEMVFKDEFTANAILVDGTIEKIDKVTLSELWNYAENNVKWDEMKGQLSFSDIDVEEVTLYDFVKSLNSFLVFSKLSKFGNVWWYASIKTDLEGSESNNSNVVIPNVSGSGFGSGNVTNVVQFWSPDKYVNDEYKRYIKEPVFYTGFLTSTDFSNGGWFTIPDLKMATKPFDKLKIAQILLSLNFVFDPAELGSYNALSLSLGSRIKDETSDTIMDVSQTKGNQNYSKFAETSLNHWVGGLISTDNLQTIGVIGNYKPENSCTEQVSSGNSFISHVLSGQISLNTNTDSRALELLNTIDPINWKSSGYDNGPHSINVLNVDRAFGVATGNADDAIVFGGVQKSDGDLPRMVDILEIWSSSGFLKKRFYTSK